ncbi:hypothetical protein HYV49_02410, partial [Candidatus Pacearchaeota archaeon]|nr:hypothetical protein [Candidatus Pacearchaeota archaeon]
MARKKRARKEEKSRGRSKNKGLYYLTFFAVFVIAFVLFSIVFLSVLSAFPDKPRVQGLFESIKILDIPFFKAFVITGRQISGYDGTCNTPQDVDDLPIWDWCRVPNSHLRDVAPCG